MSRQRAADEPPMSPSKEVKTLRLREGKKRTNGVAFAPPDLATVAEYIEAKGYPVDAETWHDHYTSNGWRVGKVPMKDWQAAVRNWARKEKVKQPEYVDNLEAF